MVALAISTRSVRMRVYAKNVGMLEQMWKICLHLLLADKGYHNMKLRALSEDWEETSSSVNLYQEW
jgi:hypothetical protein